MQIELIPIGDIHEDPSNVRSHPDEQLDRLKASLAKFGQQKPVVIGKGNVVVAGNATLRAAKALGMEALACVRTELEGANATAYAIADNRLSELSEWDVPELTLQLGSLADDFDLSDLGWSEDALAELSETVASADDESLPSEAGLFESMTFNLSPADASLVRRALSKATGDPAEGLVAISRAYLATEAG